MSLKLPPSLLCCIFGRVRQSRPVTFQSGCSLSCPEIPEEWRMKTWELGSCPQDIPLILTLFCSRQPPCCLSVQLFYCVAGEVKKDVFPESPMPLTRCSFAACYMPEVHSAVPFHEMVHDAVLKYDAQEDQFLVRKYLIWI